jgi:Tol biopolymer transport system component
MSRTDAGASESAHRGLGVTAGLDEWAYSLFTVAADGSGLRRVRTPGADDPAQPGWSPDGQRIAYAAFDGCIATQRPDGRDVRQVASCATGGAYNFGGRR